MLTVIIQGHTSQTSKTTTDVREKPEGGILVPMHPFPDWFMYEAASGQHNTWHTPPRNIDVFTWVLLGAEHVVKSYNAYLVHEEKNIRLVIISKCLIYYCRTLEVKVFHWKEFFKPNIDIFIIFFVIIAIPFIKQKMEGVHNSICDCITQLHNGSDVHSIWKKNILMKTSPIPIECLHGILRVAITGYWIDWATFSKNNFSKTVGTGISAASTTQSSSPQHPMQKIGNCSIHTPPSNLTCWKTSHSHDCCFSYWRRHSETDI